MTINYGNTCALFVVARTDIFIPHIYPEYHQCYGDHRWKLFTITSYTCRHQNGTLTAAEDIWGTTLSAVGNARQYYFHIII
jgi:hypothetical protein